MVISFNPAFPGDRFVWLNHWFDQETLELLRGARAVILPQTIGRPFYFFIKSLCPRVFPNYDTRFRWEGKIGDAFLAWSLGIPHPPTTVFPRVVSLVGDHPEMGKGPFPLPKMPFVIKANTGGEGSGTWLVRTQQDLDRILDILKREEFRGRCGFVVQEFLEGLERSLRVVVVGNHIESYWRIGERGTFYSNVARGAQIERDFDPGKKALGEKLVGKILAETGINLAGFDIYFHDGEPGLLEINYTFGLTGLGGIERFRKIFRRAVADWLAQYAPP